MSIIFETMPLTSAPNFAIVLAGICAAASSLVSLGRARYEAAG